MPEIPALADNVLEALGAKDEWVVQDGASEDGTVECIEDLHDERIRTESRPDAGIYDAMNRAVVRASGDYILFLGADDRLRIRMDEVRPVLRDGQTVYYGDVWRNESRDRYAGPFDGAKLARINICQQAIFYPRAAFDRRRFNTRYSKQADWVFNMECFSDHTLKFEYIPLLIADYGQKGASSIGFDEAFQRDYPALLKKYFTFKQNWKPLLFSRLSAVYRSLPAISAARQKPARNL